IATRSAADRRAADAAALLASDALRTFAESGHAERLDELPVGADSIVARARVRTGTDLTGAAVVRVHRADASTFSVLSVGRLDTARGPVVCAVELAWSAGEAPRLGREPVTGMICNGKPRPQRGVRTG